MGFFLIIGKGVSVQCLKPLNNSVYDGSSRTFFLLHPDYVFDLNMMSVCLNDIQQQF